jgi:general secretion pathway protein G
MIKNQEIKTLLKRKNSGMSLIEIMLVFTVIMAMLVGVFQLYKTIQKSQKKSSTQSLLAQVQTGIEGFKNDIGRYPAKLEELATGPSDAQEKRRWSENYVDRKSVIDGTVKDTFGNELVYTFDKSKNNYELYSWGPNGVGAESDQIFVQ